jgi:hypothetical protein
VVVVLFVGSAGQKTLPWQMFTGLREQISPTILAVATILVAISIVLLTVELCGAGPSGCGACRHAEMDRRQNAMRAHLAAESIDAAVFTSYHGICYYSGFLYCYFGRKYAFVLTERHSRRRSRPASMAASRGGARMAKTSSTPTGGATISSRR